MRGATDVQFLTWPKMGGAQKSISNILLDSSQIQALQFKTTVCIDYLELMFETRDRNNLVVR